MLQLMVPQENGLCIIKIKLFLLLLLAPLKPRSSDLFKGPSGELSPLPPPGTPFPSRKPQDDKRAKREELTQPRRPHQRYDIDDDDQETNKENHPPPADRSDVDWKKTVLQSLLEKWAADILWYQEEILRDLNDLRLKLGIHQSF
uniref:E4 protein n=1 Tax=Human papillomavirus TaxID=10566 RepID=A0A385PKE4_9PAPI|nr:MAG: E4 protein [Human papillomavirus]